MTQIAEGWEIVSRKANNPIYRVFMILQVLLGIPEIPRYFSAVTWTVLQTATGIVRQVTAYSQHEAGEKIRLGLFDRN